MAISIAVIFLLTVLSGTRSSSSSSDDQCKQLNPGLFYDEKTGNCLGVIGHFISLPFPVDIEMLTCPTNAVIIYGMREAGCVCRKSHLPYNDGKGCLATKSIIGENCEADLGLNGMCNSDAGLICSAPTGTGICEGEQRMIWSPSSRACSVLVRQNCFSTFECVPSSKCLQTGNNLPACECKEGFIPASDGFFYGEHGSPCMPNECLAGTRCTDGLCKCNDSLLEEYDLESKACRRLAGATCSDSQICFKESGCVDGTCVCNFGFKRDPSGICAKAKNHRQNCAEYGLQCDAGEGLACVDGNCACFSSSLTFMEGKGCLAGLGVRCGEIEGPGKKYVVPCAVGAYCSLTSRRCSRTEFIKLNGTEGGTEGLLRFRA